MISRERILNIFEETGVLQHGHFLLSSGRHADKYLQCAQVLQYPQYTNELAKGITELWSEKDIDVVIGPAIGGIIISYAVGQAFNKKAIFTERKDGEMMLKRGFQLKTGANVLIVEDVVTTGGSVKEVIDVLTEMEVNIIGITSLVDRSNGKVNFKYDFKPLLTLDVKSYQADECPLCKKEIPFTKPGSREI